MELFIVAAVFVVLVIAFRILANVRERSGQSRARQPYTRTTPNRTEMASFFEKQMQEQDEREAVAERLRYKFGKIEDALFRRKYDRAMELVSEMMHETDPKKDSAARHFTLLKILEKFYVLREENPAVYDLCLQICDLDFQNMENFIKDCNSELFSEKNASCERFNSPIYLVTTTKAAIIFEKRGDIMSAIKVCEMAIAWNAWDSGKKSFEERKARLENKLKRQMEQ